MNQITPVESDPDVKVFAEMPVLIDSLGLSVGGVYQAYWWEQDIQSRVGNLIAARHSEVANIGIGLGLSLAALESAGVTNILAVDVLKDICSREKNGRREAAGTKIVCADWLALCQKGELNSYAALYVDAFPIYNSFSYSRAEFDEIFCGILLHLTKAKYKGMIYFLSFEPSSQGTSSPSELPLDRELVTPVPQKISDHALLDAVLYSTQLSFSQ